MNREKTDTESKCASRHSLLERSCLPVGGTNELRFKSRGTSSSNAWDVGEVIGVAALDVGLQWPETPCQCQRPLSFQWLLSQWYLTVDTGR